MALVVADGALEEKSAVEVVFLIFRGCFRVRFRSTFVHSELFLDELLALSPRVGGCFPSGGEAPGVGVVPGLSM